MVAVCAYLTQMFITLGLQRVGATLGTALSYLTVVWGILFGYFLFDEVRMHCCPPSRDWLGSSADDLICVMATYWPRCTFSFLLGCHRCNTCT